MIGAYGLWAADKVLGKGPARLSFRTGKWKTLDAWRRVARRRVLECIAPVDLGGRPKVRVESKGVHDGLYVERLSWQLPMGPRTEAVFLKPAGAKGRLPAILGLHDHAGKKFLGWRKIARDGRSRRHAQSPRKAWRPTPPVAGPEPVPPLDAAFLHSPGSGRAYGPRGDPPFRAGTACVRGADGPAARPGAELRRQARATAA
jgi:hypothetical protein